MSLLVFAAAMMTPALQTRATQSCNVADAPPTSSALLEEVSRRNDLLAAARTSGDADELVVNLAPDSIIMPEHQVRLVGRSKAREYYHALFSRLRIESYAPDTADVLPLQDGAVEWGRFKLSYARLGDEARQDLNGKYLNFWRRQSDGKLKLKAEVWGFDRPLGELARDWQIGVGADSLPRSAGDLGISTELDALNAANARSVRNHDHSQIDIYAEDAVYMPYAAEPQVGKGAIRAHLIPYIEQGRGATFERVDLSNDGFEAIGNYVVEYPNFEVHWRAGSSSGVTSGGGIRLWRREPDCSLKMIRQIGVHHRP